MKFNLIYTIFTLLLGGTLLLSNAGGRASAAGKGNTGAPGDELTGNLPRVCGSCHQGATDFQVTMSVQLLDAKGNTLLGYAPDESYYVKVTLNKSGTGTPNGYGFQLVSLVGTNNDDVNGFSTPDANVQIVQASSNKRFYAEQKNGASASNIFKFKWKAPKAGSGKVTFYGAGNAVNKNGSSSGDAAATSKIELSEGFKVGVEETLQHSLVILAAPNPIVSDKTTLWINSTESEKLTLQVCDAMGKLMTQENIEVANETYRHNLDTTAWSKGIYFVSLFNQKGRVTKQIIKL
jgi:Secretion system C-terminal sorting domain